MRRSSAHAHWVALAALASMTAAAPAWAQQPDQDQEDAVVTDGGAVTTSTKRVDGVMEGRAQRVERLDPEEMERRGVTNLAQALEASSAAAGVSPTGQTRGLILDGLPASQVTVLRDGLPVAAPAGSPQGPLVDLSAIAIAPEAIERIDIYRGVGPTGSGGAGGVVIDIISKEAPEESSVMGSGQWTGGMDTRFADPASGLVNQRYMVHGAAGISPHWSAQTSGQYASFGALDVNNDGVADRSARDQFGGDVSLTYRPTRNSHLRLQAVGNRTVSEMPGGLGAAFDNRVTRRTARARLRGRWWAGRDVRIDHHTDVGRDAHDFVKRQRTSGVESTTADTTLDSATQSISATWFTRRHDVALEGNGRGWLIERTGRSGSVPEQRDARGGVGLSDTFYVNDSIELFGRVFAQGATDVDGALNAQTSFAMKLSERWSWRASASRTQRMPTPEEMYLFFDHSEVGYAVIGNPDLQPELLRSGTASVVWTDDAQTLGVEVMGFYHRLDDAIVTVATPEDPSLFTYANVQRGHTAGSQLNLQATALPGAFSALANLTYMPLAEDLDTGDQLANRATFAGRFELRRGWMGGRLQTWVDATVRSERGTPAGTPAAPGYALLGLGATGVIAEGVRLRLDVNNLLDQTNATWGPMPGLNAMMSVQVGHRFGRGDEVAHVE